MDDIKPGKKAKLRRLKDIYCEYPTFISDGIKFPDIPLGCVYTMLSRFGTDVTIDRYMSYNDSYTIKEEKMCQYSYCSSLFENHV